MKRYVDFILVFLILGSASFIGWRIFGSRENRSRPVAPHIDSRAIAPTNALPESTLAQNAPRTTQSGLPGPRSGVLAQQVLTKFRTTNKSEWLAFTQSAPISKYVVVDKTKACGDPTNPQQQALHIVVPEVGANIRNKKLAEIVFSYPRCFSVGQTLEILEYGHEPSEKFVSYLGTSRVESILELPYQDFPKSFLDFVGVEHDEFMRSVDYPSRPKSQPVIVVRFSAIETKTPPSDPVPAYLRYPVLRKDQLSSYLKAHPGAVFIDVRSEAEASAAPVPGAQRIPYALSSQGADGRVFSWDVKINDLDGRNVDISWLLENRSRHLIIVGASPNDGRPLYLLREALHSGLPNAAWLYDGVGAINR